MAKNYRKSRSGQLDCTHCLAFKWLKEHNTIWNIEKFLQGEFEYIIFHAGLEWVTEGSSLAQLLLGFSQITSKGETCENCTIKESMLFC